MFSNFYYLLRYIPSSSLLNWVLKVIGVAIQKYRGVSCKDIYWLDEISDENKLLIREPSIGKSISPLFFARAQRSCDVSIPDISLYKFTNACVTPNSSHILLGSGVVMERVTNINSDYANYSTGHIIEHDDSKAVVVCQENVDISSGVFLGGNGSWNYYHWMFEIFPKVEFIIEQGLYKNSAILVSEKVKIIESFSKMLDEAFKYLNIDIIYMDDKMSYKVDNLYYLSSPCNLVYNVRGHFCRPEDFFFRTQSFDYVKKIISSLASKNDFFITNYENPKKRIFLARRNGSIRSYNQTEVIELLSLYDFTVLYMEDLSLEEQFFTFRNAEVIVGASGAAWSNLLFCQKGTKAISWLAENVGDFSVFSSLSSYAGVDLRFFKTKATKTEKFHENYEVDLELLRAMIVVTLDA